MPDPGTVYLLHFTQPVAHARHYVGWAANLDGRLGHHRRGNGSALMRALMLAGGDFIVATQAPGDRNHERWIKRQKNTPEFCPYCTDKPRSLEVRSHV